MWQLELCRSQNTRRQATGGGHVFQESHENDHGSTGVQELTKDMFLAVTWRGCMVIKDVSAKEAISVHFFRAQLRTDDVHDLVHHDHTTWPYDGFPEGIECTSVEGSLVFQQHWKKNSSQVGSAALDRDFYGLRDAEPSPDGVPPTLRNTDCGRCN